MAGLEFSFPEHYFSFPERYFSFPERYFSFPEPVEGSEN